MRHPDFQKIYDAFMWRYCQDHKECDIGESYYYGWLQKMGLDDTKPYQKPQERFSWAEPYLQFVKEDEQARYFKVEALFPLSSMNNNLYTQYELLRGARSLVGRPVNLNHTGQMLPEVTIHDADYEDDGVECLLRVSKNSRVLQLIEKGEIIHVSIEADCLRGSERTPEGNLCKGLVFTGLALLTKDTLPGVPLTRIMPVERLVEGFTVAEMRELDEKATEKNENSPTQGEKPRETGVVSQAQQVAPPEENGDHNENGKLKSETDRLEKRIVDLEAKVSSLTSKVDTLVPKTEIKEEKPRESCKCVLTKEGFWARFHELRSQGASKTEAFRLVSLEVIQAVSKQT
jgi:hypothetical protein